MSEPEPDPSGWGTGLDPRHLVRSYPAGEGNGGGDTQQQQQQVPTATSSRNTENNSNNNNNTYSSAYSDSNVHEQRSVRPLSFLSSVDRHSSRASATTSGNSDTHLRRVILSPARTPSERSVQSSLSSGDEPLSPTTPLRPAGRMVQHATPRTAAEEAQVEHELMAESPSQRSFRSSLPSVSDTGTGTDDQQHIFEELQRSLRFPDIYTFPRTQLTHISEASRESLLSLSVPASRPQSMHVPPPPRPASTVPPATAPSTAAPVPPRTAPPGSERDVDRALSRLAGRAGELIALFEERAASPTRGVSPTLSSSASMPAFSAVSTQQRTVTVTGAESTGYARSTTMSSLESASRARTESARSPDPARTPLSPIRLPLTPRRAKPAVERRDAPSPTPSGGSERSPSGSGRRVSRRSERENIPVVEDLPTYERGGYTGKREEKTRVGGAGGAPAPGGNGSESGSGDGSGRSEGREAGSVRSRGSGGSQGRGDDVRSLWMGGREPFRTGYLYYLNVHTGPPYQWVHARALLYPTTLILIFTTPLGQRGTVTIDLVHATEVRSVPSPTHPAGWDDIGSVAARAQGGLVGRAGAGEGEEGGRTLEERLCPFHLLYADGIERLGAESARERVRWVSAIWDFLSRPPGASSLTPTPSIRSISSFDSLPRSLPRSERSSRAGSVLTTYEQAESVSPLPLSTPSASSRPGSEIGSIPSLRASDDQGPLRMLPGQEIALSRGSSIRRTSSVGDLQEEFVRVGTPQRQGSTRAVTASSGVLTAGQEHGPLALSPPPTPSSRRSQTGYASPRSRMSAASPAGSARSSLFMTVSEPSGVDMLRGTITPGTYIVPSSLSLLRSGEESLLGDRHEGSPSRSRSPALSRSGGVRRAARATPSPTPSSGYESASQRLSVSDYSTASARTPAPSEHDRDRSRTPTSSLGFDICFETDLSGMSSPPDQFSPPSRIVRTLPPIAAVLRQPTPTPTPPQTSYGTASERRTASAYASVSEGERTPTEYGVPEEGERTPTEYVSPPEGSRTPTAYGTPPEPTPTPSTHYSSLPTLSTEYGSAVAASTEYDTVRQASTEYGSLPTLSTEYASLPTLSSEREWMDAEEPPRSESFYTADRAPSTPRIPSPVPSSVPPPSPSPVPSRAPTEPSSLPPLPPSSPEVPSSIPSIPSERIPRTPTPTMGRIRSVTEPSEPSTPRSFTLPYEPSTRTPTPTMARLRSISQDEPRSPPSPSPSPSPSPPPSPSESPISSDTGTLYPASPDSSPGTLSIPFEESPTPPPPPSPLPSISGYSYDSSRLFPSLSTQSPPAPVFDASFDTSFLRPSTPGAPGDMGYELVRVMPPVEEISLPSVPMFVDGEAQVTPGLAPSPVMPTFPEVPPETPLEEYPSLPPSPPPPSDVPTPATYRPSIHSLTTVPSDIDYMDEPPMPSNIVTHDVNRLLQYLHGVNQAREEDARELVDHIARIEEGLDEITNMLREPPVMPPTQSPPQQDRSPTPLARPAYPTRAPPPSKESEPLELPDVTELTPPLQHRISIKSTSSSISYLSSHYSDEASLFGDAEEISPEPSEKTISRVPSPAATESTVRPPRRPVELDSLRDMLQRVLDQNSRLLDSQRVLEDQMERCVEAQPPADQQEMERRRTSTLNKIEDLLRRILRRVGDESEPATSPRDSVTGTMPDMVEPPVIYSPQPRLPPVQSPLLSDSLERLSPSILEAVPPPSIDIPMTGLDLPGVRRRPRPVRPRSASPVMSDRPEPSRYPPFEPFRLGSPGISEFSDVRPGRRRQPYDYDMDFENMLRQRRAMKPGASPDGVFIPPPPPGQPRPPAEEGEGDFYPPRPPTAPPATIAEGPGRVSQTWYTPRRPQGEQATGAPIGPVGDGGVPLIRLGPEYPGAGAPPPMGPPGPITPAQIADLRDQIQRGHLLAEQGVRQGNEIMRYLTDLNSFLRRDTGTNQAEMADVRRRLDDIADELERALPNFRSYTRDERMGPPMPGMPPGPPPPPMGGMGSRYPPIPGIGEGLYDPNLPYFDVPPGFVPGQPGFGMGQPGFVPGGVPIPGIPGINPFGAPPFGGGFPPGPGFPLGQGQGFPIPGIDQSIDPRSRVGVPPSGLRDDGIRPPPPRMDETIGTGGVPVPPMPVATPGSAVPGAPYPVYPPGTGAYPPPPPPQMGASGVPVPPMPATSGVNITNIMPPAERLATGQSPAAPTHADLAEPEDEHAHEPERHEERLVPMPDGSQAPPGVSRLAETAPEPIPSQRPPDPIPAPPGAPAPVATYSSGPEIVVPMMPSPSGVPLPVSEDEEERAASAPRSRERTPIAEHEHRLEAQPTEPAEHRGTTIELMPDGRTLIHTGDQPPQESVLPHEELAPPTQPPLPYAPTMPSQFPGSQYPEDEGIREPQPQHGYLGSAPREDVPMSPAPPLRVMSPSGTHLEPPAVRIRSPRQQQPQYLPPSGAYQAQPPQPEYRQAEERAHPPPAVPEGRAAEPEYEEPPRHEPEFAARPPASSQAVHEAPPPPRAAEGGRPSPPRGRPSPPPSDHPVSEAEEPEPEPEPEHEDRGGRPPVEHAPRTPPQVTVPAGQSEEERQESPPRRATPPRASPPSRERDREGPPPAQHQGREEPSHEEEEGPEESEGPAEEEPEPHRPSPPRRPRADEGVHEARPESIAPTHVPSVHVSFHEERPPSLPASEVGGGEPSPPPRPLPTPPRAGEALPEERAAQAPRTAEPTAIRVRSRPAEGQAAAGGAPFDPSALHEMMGRHDSAAQEGERRRQQLFEEGQTARQTRLEAADSEEQQRQAIFEQNERERWNIFEEGERSRAAQWDDQRQRVFEEAERLRTQIHEDNTRPRVESRSRPPSIAEEGAHGPPSAAEEGVPAAEAEGVPEAESSPRPEELEAPEEPEYHSPAHDSEHEEEYRAPSSPGQPRSPSEGEAPVVEPSEAAEEAAGIPPTGSPLSRTPAGRGAAIRVRSPFDGVPGRAAGLPGSRLRPGAEDETGTVIIPTSEGPVEVVSGDPHERLGGPAEVGGAPDPQSEAARLQALADFERAERVRITEEAEAARLAREEERAAREAEHILELEAERERVRQLEADLAASRQAAEQERQDRMTADLARYEAERQATIERENACKDQLADIRNILQDRSNEQARWREVDDERWQEKQTRMEEKAQKLQSLEDLVNRIISDREEDRRRAEDESQGRPTLDNLLEQMQKQAADQAALLQQLSDTWRADSDRQHFDTLEAVRAAAAEQVPYNIQTYLNEFSKALAAEVRQLLHEVGKLREERRSLQYEIGELMCLKAKHGPGGTFAPDWKPEAPPAPAPAPPPPTGPEPPPPPPPAAWRKVEPKIERQSRRGKKAKEEAAPPAAPPAPPPPNWQTWQPNPLLAPPPPTTAASTADVRVPGLFGPRSPSRKGEHLP